MKKVESKTLESVSANVIHENTLRPLPFNVVELPNFAVVIDSEQCIKFGKQHPDENTKH